VHGKWGAEERRLSHLGNQYDRPSRTVESSQFPSIRSQGSRDHRTGCRSGMAASGWSYLQLGAIWSRQPARFPSIPPPCRMRIWVESGTPRNGYSPPYCPFVLRLSYGRPAEKRIFDQTLLTDWNDRRR